jgi:hypothetical protein
MWVIRHRGLGTVDVLAAGTAGPVDIHPQIRRIDLDVDIIIDLRGDEHRGKRGMPAVAGVERRLAHEPVYAGFGAQPAIGMVTAHVHRRALDPGHLAGRHLEQFRIKSHQLGIHQVHAQQHLGPVLRLGAALPRVDVDEGIVFVHRAGKHAAELELGDLLLEPVGVRRDAGDCSCIAFLGRDLQQFDAVTGTLGELVEQLDDVLELGALPAERLRLLRVCPRRRDPLARAELPRAAPA